MPQWGDKTHDWAAIDACVEIMHAELECTAKEKFGYLRCYMGKVKKKTYRAAYKKCLDKYPHMKKYILMDADYPEYLVGLVTECDHPGWWVGNGKRRCGVCGKEEVV